MFETIPGTIRPDMPPGLRELLGRYDEEGAFEFPKNFDYPDLERRAKQVASALEARGNRIKFEDANYNQDASFSIAILLSDYEKVEGQAIYVPTIRFSNFGDLATLTWTERAPNEAVEAVKKFLEDNGFSYVPEHELDTAYDGVMDDKETFRTWWIRYFDFL